jgi:3-methylcrotonyl-CoA carboxylase alpha subunit
MRAAGVPVLPGYEGSQQDLTHLEREALDLGPPLIIKPAAGGGGKGMRIVRHEAEIREALAGARRLAESGFGNGALLLERFLQAPRHVEVQVFADIQGNFVHLGDRDCSVQRRHQKLIEEAPAPSVPEDVRSRMRAAALVVAREIGYVSAGTVEFLLDGREFYFMEMNTRLQVEHTVTEAVTGLDLVEWQLRVADGESLPLSQADIHLEGHAIEARVCAEDPERDFLPSAGELRLMQWPAGESVRVDAGFDTGDVVPANYDSLLGKVIAWAPSREQAAARLSGALEHTYCAGVQTNEKWLSRVLRFPRFLEARHSIAVLEQGAAEFAGSRVPEPQAIALAALAAHAGHADGGPQAHGRRVQLPSSPWDLNDGFTPNLPATTTYSLSWHGRSHAVEIEFAQGVPSSLLIDMQTKIGITGVSFAGGVIAVNTDTRRPTARYLLDGSHVHIWMKGEHYEFVLEDPRTREFSAMAAQGGLTTPLPGVVAAVEVEVGQKVAPGDVLMVIEAMKMEHAITAPYEGTVQAIHFAPGDRVPQDSELLELSPTEAA